MSLQSGRSPWRLCSILKSSVWERAEDMVGKLGAEWPDFPCLRPGVGCLPTQTVRSHIASADKRCDDRRQLAGIIGEATASKLYTKNQHMHLFAAKE